VLSRIAIGHTPLRWPVLGWCYPWAHRAKAAAAEAELGSLARNNLGVGYKDGEHLESKGEGRVQLVTQLEPFSTSTLLASCSGATCALICTPSLYHASPF
jgi:hypothetical protein